MIDAYDLLVEGLRLAEGHEFDRADALVAQALELAPHDPGILTGVAVRYRQQGRLSEAVRLCDQAIALAPEYPDAWLERGAILAAGGSSRAARDSFAQAAILAPDNPAAHAGLASQAARDGDLVSADAAARRALELDPANLVAAAALGSVLLERRDPNGALAVLGAPVAAAPSSHNRSLAAGTLGRALERLDRHAEAYAAFALAKQDFAAVNDVHAADRPTQTAFVESIAGALAAVPIDAVRPVADASAGSVAPHVFLIGYPRSGTTLVENVLASLPGVAAVEEWPSFRDADMGWLGGESGIVGDGLARFMALEADGVAALQAGYWAQARAGGMPADAAALVDMDPLKATRLPFIARMFPAARVLVMRRDPRDVVWSCFRTSFALTSGTLEYTTLERTARHYDAMMRLTDLALARLPVAAHEVRYERLVRDFDATTRAMCEFAGLAWSEDLRRFDRTARARGVGTASATQVRRGLYDGSGQWRPYAQWLKPVLPILQPWIDRYGSEA